LLVVFGALLLMASGGTIVGTKVLISKVSNSLHQDNSLIQTKHVSIKGPVNILLVGVDHRDGSHEDGTRSDSIIIVHIPASHDRAYLVSIPRDSVVPIPAFPKTHFAGSPGDRINSAFYHGSVQGGGMSGGFQLLAGTIQSLSGIQFSAGAIINFDGFKALVEALGGVHMCVDEKVTSIHIGFDANGKRAKPFHENPDLSLTPIPGVKPQVYYPKCQDLKPWQALDYVRQRDIMSKNDGDYGRQRHQQQFIKAVFKEAVSKGLTNPTKINSIIGAVGKAMTVSLGGVSLDDWLMNMGGVKDMVMLKSNGGKFNANMVGNQYTGEKLSPETLQLFQSVRDDTVQDFVAAHPSWVSKDH
jgi:LCP family protein required for cell wall assembly